MGKETSFNSDYPLKRHDLHTDSIKIAPGYVVYGDYFTPVTGTADNMNKDIYWDVAENGRIIFKTPSGSDTTYFTTPSNWINDKIPTGTDTNQQLAKQKWFDLLKTAKTSSTDSRA